MCNVHLKNNVGINFQHLGLKLDFCAFIYEHTWTESAAFLEFLAQILRTICGLFKDKDISMFVHVCS